MNSGFFSAYFFLQLCTCMPEINNVAPWRGGGGGVTPNSGFKDENTEVATHWRHCDISSSKWRQSSPACVYRSFPLPVPRPCTRISASSLVSEPEPLRDFYRRAGTRFVSVVRAVQKYDIMRQHDSFFINVHSVRNALGLINAVLRSTWSSPPPHTCVSSAPSLWETKDAFFHSLKVYTYFLWHAVEAGCSCQYHHHFTSPLFLPLGPLWTDSSTHKFDTSIFRGPACKKSQSKQTSVGVGWC